MQLPTDYVYRGSPITAAIRKKKKQQFEKFP